jgi:hypothetical protein
MSGIYIVFFLEFYCANSFGILLVIFAYQLFPKAYLPYNLSIYNMHPIGCTFDVILYRQNSFWLEPVP